MFTNAEIGVRIEERRTQAGLTMDELAEQIGVNKSTIHRYEKGQVKKIKLPVIESIAMALNVNPDWLIGNTDDPTPKITTVSAMTFDDFTYAMHNHSGKLTDKDKEILLSMAQQLADAHGKKDVVGDAD